jgi:hypothetical protein
MSDPMPPGEPMPKPDEPEESLKWRAVRRDFAFDATVRVKAPDLGSVGSFLMGWLT